jgi:hypothetical protein
MVSSLRTFASIGLAAVALSSTGCKKDEPPNATAEPTKPAIVASMPPRSKLNIRQPMAVPRIDPQVMKDYRIDVCYFGTLSLRQARDAYLASLGGAEPGPSKIPSFGLPQPPAPPGSSAAPATSAAPAASASAGPRLTRPSGEFVPRPPHERNARACSVARGLKDPAMPEVDAALAGFSDYSIELSKDIAAAVAYYQRKDYEQDKFAKGKELHKKLKDEFAKLDELSEKLGTAVVAWRKEHPLDTSKMEDGQKDAQEAFDDARGMMLAIATHKTDPAAFKADLAKLDKSLEALKARAQKDATDPWSKLVTPIADDFSKLGAEAAPKVTDKGVDSEAYFKLVQGFVNLVEARQRALSRSLMMKAQAEQAAAAASASGDAPGTPAPAAPASAHP